MAADGLTNPARQPEDPRAAALAAYLRRWAAAFSLSADTTHLSSTAEAGMALLDAASVAESMPPDDERIRKLSEAGLFESMPGGQATFLETPEIRALICRPLSSEAQSGVAIVAQLVAAAAAPGGPPGSPLR